MTGAHSATALLPPGPERRRWDDHLTAVLAAAAQRVARGKVTPEFDRGAFEAELAAFDFRRPMPLAELFGWTVAQLERGLVHVTHPRYLGLFNPAPSFPAQGAERIAASFNPQLASAATSPAAVAIEAHVGRALAARAGLPRGAVGQFTSGGSEANHTALACALTRAEPGFAGGGARAFAGRPVFYISGDSHLAWIKIAHLAGLGRDAARLVATDGSGRISLPALHAAIAADRSAGCVPVMVVATAGTTNAGMVDPLRQCGEIARAAGAWLHVDAAWGGGLVASDRLRGLLAGIERADSVTIDAHEWFAATMGCGLFLTPHPAVLRAAFAVRADFMPANAASSPIPATDPYLTGMQWSQRFLGLRLFLSLAAGGWAAHAAHVERATLLAARFADGMQALGWTVVNDPALAVVCLQPPDGSPPVREVVARVLASGDAWVSAAVFEGRDVVRACITHGETTISDLAEVARLLEHASRSPEMPAATAGDLPAATAGPQAPHRAPGVRRAASDGRHQMAGVQQCWPDPYSVAASAC